MFWPKSHDIYHIIIMTFKSISRPLSGAPGSVRPDGLIVRLWQCETEDFNWWMQNTSQQWSLSSGLSSLEHSCSTLTPDELLIGHEMGSPQRSHDPSERLLRSCSLPSLPACFPRLCVTDRNVVLSVNVQTPA